MTVDEAKAKVRARWPEATCNEAFDTESLMSLCFWTVTTPIDRRNRIVRGSGPSKSAAWLDAARRMENEGGQTP